MFAAAAGPGAGRRHAADAGGAGGARPRRWRWPSGAGRGRVGEGAGAVIVSVCSDKGSPGVTTLAVALGLVWPGERVVLEADTAGGDLAFRLRPAGRTAAGRGWRRTRRSRRWPRRPGWAAGGGTVAVRAADTSLGVPVVPGALSAERFRPLRPLWPRVAGGVGGLAGHGARRPGPAAAGEPGAAGGAGRRPACCWWPGPTWRACTICGTGWRSSPGRWVTRARDRPGGGGGDRPGRGAEGRRWSRPGRCWPSIGSPVPVAGFLRARPGRRRRRCGRGEVTRRLAGSDLVRSARSLAETVLGWWPALVRRRRTGPAKPRRHRTSDSATVTRRGTVAGRDRADDRDVAGLRAGAAAAGAGRRRDDPGEAGPGAPRAAGAVGAGRAAGGAEPDQRTRCRGTRRS